MSIVTVDSIKMKMSECDRTQIRDVCVLTLNKHTTYLAGVRSIIFSPFRVSEQKMSEPPKRRRVTPLVPSEVKKK